MHTKASLSSTQDAADVTSVNWYPQDAPWTKNSDGTVSLTGSQCRDCDTSTFPKLPACPACGGTVEEVALASSGSLYSFTQIHVGRRPFPRNYTLGFVDLDGNVRVTAPLDMSDDLRIGARVECILGPLNPDLEEHTISYRFRVATVNGDSK